MKQFQAAYRDRDSFRDTLVGWETWRAENACGQALIHIFSDGADDADVMAVRDIVEQVMPDAAYLGASASGNIYEGNITTESWSSPVRYLNVPTVLCAPACFPSRTGTRPHCGQRFGR